MSIAKPFTFTANTYAKASEVNADFDIVYAQVNTNISNIAQNATDIDNLESNKADKAGSTTQVFKVADPIASNDAVNKQTLSRQIANSVDYIGGLTITKDSGNPEDTIIVNAGSAYDSTKSVVLNLASSTSKQNLNQGASTTYYVYIIGNSDGTLVDILISSNSTTPTLPDGYTLYRQIGYYTTNSDSEIDTIGYYGMAVNSDVSPNGIADALMPNYSAGISISSGDSAIANGLIIAIGATSDGQQGNMYVNSVKVGNNWNGAQGGQQGFSYRVFVSKDDVVTWDTTYTPITAKFYPLKGAN